MSSISAPDTPVALIKTTRDLKEATPPITNDTKPHAVADRKSIIRENSHETSDKDLENERKATVVRFIWTQHTRK